MTTKPIDSLIKIEGEIDFSVKPNECRVKKVGDNVWEDFGYWLECVGWMALCAMKYREWSKEQILNYVREYLEKCLDDYQIKSLPK